MASSKLAAGSMAWSACGAHLLSPAQFRKPLLSCQSRCSNVLQTRTRFLHNTRHIDRSPKSSFLPPRRACPIANSSFSSPALLCTFSILPSGESNWLRNDHVVSPRLVTPSEIEAIAQAPSKHSLVRFIREILAFIDDWVIEPLLTVRRFVHILLLFLPVMLSSPMVYVGKRTKDGDRPGTLWWYDFLSAQMERAGPTFIKLAQWIASRTDLFPTALCTRLSKLHSHVDPHDFAYTKQVVEEAFGQSLSEVFSEFDTKPLGVGAIAQVYKAKLRPSVIVQHMKEEFTIKDNIITPDCVQTLDTDGNIINIHTAVAVKILHPKSRQIVYRDLKIMSVFAKMLTWIPTMHWLSLPDEVAVFGSMMCDQLDLRIEASNLQRFGRLFADTTNVEFPRPLIAFTTKNMLLEEYERGIPLNAFLEQAAYEKEKSQAPGIYDHQIANIGLSAFLHMLIFHNFVHADLHPGNIMVKFYKPSAHHPVQIALSKIFGRNLTDDGEIAVERILKVRGDPEAVHKELASLADEGYAPRLVFIDAGLVNELNDVNRRNFLDLFQAIAQFDGYHAGELMVERCRTPDLVIDPDVFALRMQNLILNLKQRTFNLGAIKIGNLLHEAMNMVRAHHVKLEGDFVNVVVSIMLLEGIGRQLNPDLDLFKSALPVLRDYSIKDRGKVALETMKDLQQHGNTPHWIKVWLFLELRSLFGRNTRENEWLLDCDLRCFNN